MSFSPQRQRKSAIFKSNFILQNKFLNLGRKYFFGGNVYSITLTCLFSCFQESSISILREDEDDDAEVGDILNDEEINNILDEAEEEAEK